MVIAMDDGTMDMGIHMAANSVEMEDAVVSATWTEIRKDVAKMDMDINGIAERIQDEEANHILFHLNHDPYSIYCFSMDEDWKSTPFVRHECSFIPKTIRTFKKYPYTLISSTKTVSVINSVILFFLCFFLFDFYLF